MQKASRFPEDSRGCQQGQQHPWTGAWHPGLNRGGISLTLQSSLGGEKMSHAALYSTQFCLSDTGAKEGGGIHPITQLTHSHYLLDRIGHLMLAGSHKSTDTANPSGIYHAIGPECNERSARCGVKQKPLDDHTVLRRDQWGQEVNDVSAFLANGVEQEWRSRRGGAGEEEQEWRRSGGAGEEEQEWRRRRGGAGEEEEERRSRRGEEEERSRRGGAGVEEQEWRSRSGGGGEEEQERRGGGEEQQRRRRRGGAGEERRRSRRGEEEERRSRRGEEEERRRSGGADEEE
ncbi:hypothetical protein DPEC_G00304760 [Dallia pectoralis]|uniref:Uncharacterized protein n=1 Tax=Dallia pectoralis TaxID=75939 RepID=A0ACC2FDM2_DALPE|nr:hypothetical protein DPEC_G00304760 [Dallia pectoralis]